MSILTRLDADSTPTDNGTESIYDIAVGHADNHFGRSLTSNAKPAFTFKNPGRPCNFLCSIHFEFSRNADGPCRETRAVLPAVYGRRMLIEWPYCTTNTRKALASRTFAMFLQNAKNPLCPVGNLFVAPNRCGINSMSIPIRSTIL